MGRYLSPPPQRFASPNIVRPYLILLKSYSKNLPHTNHCIARMLHRLAVDLKMDALLFQLSVFNLFNKILSDPAAAAYRVQWQQRVCCPGSFWLYRVYCRLVPTKRLPVDTVLHRSWWPLASICWTVSSPWQHKTTRHMWNCCSGKMWELYVRWQRATAKTGLCHFVLLCVCVCFMLNLLFLPSYRLKMHFD